MNTLRSIIRPVAFALAIAFAVAPMTAFADQKPAQAQQQGVHGKKGQHFPMKAEAFKKHVEKRIEKARAKLDKMIEKRDLPPGIEAQMKKDFDAGAAKIRAAADKAAADGTVTQEEAATVHQVAKDQRKELRTKYADKAKGHGKKGEKRERKGRRERKS